MSFDCEPQFPARIELNRGEPQPARWLGPHEPRDLAPPEQVLGRPLCSGEELRIGHQGSLGSQLGQPGGVGSHPGSQSLGSLAALIRQPLREAFPAVQSAPTPRHADGSGPEFDAWFRVEPLPAAAPAQRSPFTVIWNPDNRGALLKLGASV